MELVTRLIKCPTNKPLWIAPLGDIQWAGRPEQLAWRQLQDYVKRAVDLGAWFLGMGDYIDAFSPSNRQRLRAAALYDTATEVIEDKTKALVQELYDTLLQPATGRFLGLLEGHHWAPLMTGETSDQYLCSLLQAPFLGTTAYVGLSFETPYGTRMVTLWAHHGAGGGQKVHAPVLKLENLSTNWDADVMLVGHMTKRALGVIQRCHPVWNSSPHPVLRHRDIHLVGVGGWLKGYQERSRQGQTPRGSYVEQKMLAPVALGSPLIRITPRLRHEWRGKMRTTYWEPEIRVET